MDELCRCGKIAHNLFWSPDRSVVCSVLSCFVSPNPLLTGKCEFIKVRKKFCPLPGKLGTDGAYLSNCSIQTVFMESKVNKDERKVSG